MSKDLGNIHEKNAHRYEVAQGFGVEVERQAFHTLVEANHWLSKFRDESFVQVWESSKDQDWEGPPVWVFRSPGGSRKEVNNVKRKFRCWIDR